MQIKWLQIQNTNSRHPFQNARNVIDGNSKQFFELTTKMLRENRLTATAIFIYNAVIVFYVHRIADMRPIFMKRRI